VEVALLTSSGNGVGNSARMPSSDTGNLSQTLVGLARQLGCAPSAGDTLVAVTLGDTDGVDHLILGEDLVDGHLLLQVIAGKLHLVGD